jgi:hypothetical protein
LFALTAFGSAVTSQLAVRAVHEQAVHFGGVGGNVQEALVQAVSPAAPPTPSCSTRSTVSARIASTILNEVSAWAASARAMFEVLAAVSSSWPWRAAHRLQPWMPTSSAQKQASKAIVRPTSGRRIWFRCFRRGAELDGIDCKYASGTAAA